MPNQKFILNDETKVNQFGFRVLNLGLDLERFRANPVILDYHQEGNDAVIGRWENIEIEGHLLTAEAVFDLDDPIAKKIAGKVERGFLRGSSLGLNPFSMSNFQIAPDGTYDLVLSEVLESSIVPIPNNANAVKLYAATEDGITELAEQDISQILLMANDISKFNNNSMKKITLNLSAIAALGLPGTTLEHDENLVNEKIINLKSELDAAKLKITGFEDLEKDKKSKLSADTVKADIAAGKIDATKEADYIKLHAEFPSLYKSTVTDLPAKNKLAAQVNAVQVGEVKNLDDFQKLDLSAQLEFKNVNPDLYNSLFK